MCHTTGNPTGDHTKVRHFGFAGLEAKLSAPKSLESNALWSLQCGCSVEKKVCQSESVLRTNDENSTKRLDRERLPLCGACLALASTGAKFRLVVFFL